MLFSSSLFWLHTPERQVTDSGSQSQTQRQVPLGPCLYKTQLGQVTPLKRFLFSKFVSTEQHCLLQWKEDKFDFISYIRNCMSKLAPCIQCTPVLVKYCLKSGQILKPNKYQKEKKIGYLCEKYLFLVSYHKFKEGSDFSAYSPSYPTTKLCAQHMISS